MLNELVRDPAIHQRYQFLLYLYPTGMPLPIAASGLRDALEEARLRYNADGAHPAFSQMVLLGHSMGGLLANAMTLKSDDHLWQINTDRDFDDIVGPAAVLDELRHYTFFDWVPAVKRVVLMATPHRGSDYSTRFVGRLGSGLIAESDHYTKLLGLLIKENPNAFPPRFKRLPTSIETLDPNSPVLQAFLQMSRNPDARVHSIIGSLRPDNVTQTTDGVVAYKSAHIDGVPEKIVRSDHGVQKDPAAIQEVRRILLEHIADHESTGIARSPSLEIPIRRD
jgi:pimeloyl-ACP methyl ester carboxylesterase